MLRDINETKELDSVFPKSEDCEVYWMIWVSPSTLHKIPSKAALDSTRLDELDTLNNTGGLEVDITLEIDNIYPRFWK